MLEDGLVQILVVCRPPGGVGLGLVGGVMPEGIFFFVTRVISVRHLSNAKTTFLAEMCQWIKGKSHVRGKSLDFTL